LGGEIERGRNGSVIKWVGKEIDREELTPNQKKMKFIADFGKFWGVLESFGKFWGV
jgi:hypothetical protein